MMGKISLRNLVFACVFIPIGFLVIFSMVGCPAFRPPGEINADADLQSQPLEAVSLPQALREALPNEVWRTMTDDQGFAYGPSGPLQEGRWSNQALAGDLNRALGFIDKGSLPFALKNLERHYGIYPAKVLGRQPGGVDEMPETRRGLLGYGLIRYNRAVVLMRMAQLLDPRDRKRDQLLQRACYDLRRSIGAFERLGNLDRFGGEPYWGRDVMAWDGFALEAGDSGLAIHQVYANLAITYLRLGESSGYPQVERNYMAREDRKYTTGQTQLSATTSLLIQSCLEGDPPSVRKYRLTMALQNLEAASRGMANAGETRFNYTIGLLLAQLYRLEEGVVPEHAVGFLELAARGKTTGSEAAIGMTAKRELALIYLELGRDERFLSSMADLVPAALRGSQSKRISEKKLHFADVALYGHLRRGEWATAANHIAFREDELAGQLANDTVLENQAALVTAVCKASMKAFRQRLRSQWLSGEGDRVTGYMLGLRDHQALQGDAPVAKAFQRHTWRIMKRYPGTRTSLYLANRSWLRVVFIILPWLLLLGLFVYVFWFWRSHRRIAANRLQSGYAEEIHQS